MRKLLLTVVYYSLFVPIAGVVRLFHDPLNRKWDPERATYWSFDDGGIDAREEDSAAGTERHPATAGPLRP